MLTIYSPSYLRYIPSELSQIWTYTIPDFPEFYRRITLDPFSIKPNKYYMDCMSTVIFVDVSQER